MADLQLSYSWFRDQIPDIDLSGLEGRIDVLHEIEGTILPAYGRAHSIGLGASVGLDGWVISADVGAKFHQDNLDGSQIGVKNPEIRSVLQVDHPFAVGEQQLFVTAGAIHRLVLFDEDAWNSEFSPLLELIVGSLHDRELFQDEPSHWYLIARLQTSFLREQLSVETTGAWGISEEALHLAPRASYAISDTWSVAAGANLWFTLDGPDSTKVGLVAPGRRQGQRAHPDHAPLLTPPLRRSCFSAYEPLAICLVSLTSVAPKRGVKSALPTVSSLSSSESSYVSFSCARASAPPGRPAAASIGTIAASETVISVAVTSILPVTVVNGRAAGKTGGVLVILR